MLAPPPPLPPPPTGLNRALIKEALRELGIAGAARIGNFLGYKGQEEIGEIFRQAEDLAAAGERRRAWINNQVLFSLPEDDGS